MPSLIKYSREEHYIFDSSVFTSFVDGGNSRVYINGRLASITNAKSCTGYFFLTQGGQLYGVEKSVPSCAAGGKRYWEGNGGAARLGPCSVDGKMGVEWQHPAMKYVSPRQACISNDGVLLSTSQDGKTTMKLTQLVRRNIPASLFDPPANAKIISWVQLEEMNRPRY
jgi:hypothetical protein